MKYSEFKFKTFDGLSLFGQSWQPEDRPRAVVCLVHGLGEHRRYFFFTGGCK
jgi:alpha-beta hydrolase superfamily lysophospholipase